ncbi:uncharacterized protein LOC129005202 [Macrosteles quadrilineatus]|uniref:uncharacterized protein LOC129005202 n=1 Tax=Macrosteles quadrilineatus TaxID=74068 RepID=UPI0023E0B0C9|nr:uncharacterized protein LOC129005202 [Macrosteles quadrilineatus]
MELLLENALNPTVHRMLVNDLNNNDRWLNIVEKLRTYRIPVFLNVNRARELERRGISAAQWLLEELFDRECSYNEFCAMLREFDMLEELSLLTHAEPMIIQVQPGGGEDIVRVESGSVLELTCVASGIPRPTYQWYYHNNVLPGQSNNTLTISPFSEKNVGVYWCLLRQEIRGHINETHSSEVVVDLMAVRPVLLVDLPRVRSVPSRQTLVLTVQALGYPAPHYEWFRSSDHVVVDLMAVRPVLLVDLPRVRSVPSRQTLVLTVQAEGYPEPHYEWFRSSDHVVVDLMAVRPVLLVDLPRVRSVPSRQTLVVVDLMAVRPVLLVDLPRVRSVPSRQTLVLTVQAEGYPAPHYEWFHSSDHVVVDLMAVRPVLLVDLPRVRSVPSRQTLVVVDLMAVRPVLLVDLPRVRSVPSRQTLVVVDLMAVRPVLLVDLPRVRSVPSRQTLVVVDLMAVRPVLLVDLPRVRSVPSRQTLVLTVQAEGYPAPHYEWFRSSDDDCAMPNIVLNESSNLIEVKNAGLYDEGLYCCRVYNEAGEIFSSTCRLSVFERPPDDYLASAKVALLIGNEDYLDAELQGLHAPSNDVAVLASILSRLGFHVVALHNLTRTEMYNAFRWFCSILPENAYAFFYFAGHGFSKLASKFMMPIDCPKEEIQLHDCLCDEQLTQILAQGEQLQLLVMLFDCCLVESRDLSIGRTEFEHDLGNCNIVLGTATRNYQNAYESDADANGLFVNHLREHLEDNLPIIEVLRANQRDFREKQQQPTIFFSGADNCSLTDPVVENAQLEEKLRSEVDFEVEKKIYFKRINKGFTIYITKNKNCFLNSVDLQFPEDFTYNFSVEINSQDVKLAVEHRTVTIHNLQRVKSCLYITVFINGLRREDEGFVSGPHDSCEFTLNCPIIQRQLWHNPGTYDPILNPTMLGS